MAKKITIRDVAREAGVSTSLVSMVLNAKRDKDGNLDCNVNKDTAKRVIEVIKRLGYRPNKAAASLRSGRAYTIGVVVPDISNRFFSHLCKRVETIAAEEGCVVQFSSFDEDAEKFSETIETYVSSGVEGLIIAPCLNGDPAIRRAVDADIPVVVVDRDTAVEGVGSVCLDNERAGRMIVGHLYRNGYRKIEMIANNSGLSSMCGRISGYVEAMSKFGLQEYSAVHYVDTESIYDDILKVLSEFRDRDVDAVILPASSLSVCGLKAIKDLRLKIPEDIAVVGFEENDIFFIHEPSVTHVYQSISEMGTRAFHMLKSMIENGEKPASVILQPELTEGGSSASRVDVVADEDFPLLKVSKSNSILVSGSMFDDKGGWTIDSQYIDQMGSTYLLAHGLGKPVADAVTEIDVLVGGQYNLFVRTRNWTASFSDATTPGVFNVLIDGKPQDVVFGKEGGQWHWQDGGSVFLPKGRHQISVRDLTGFDGRFDALLFTQLKGCPDNSLETLHCLRNNLLTCNPVAEDAGEFDFVVVGGGVAGMCAAIAAARKGLKVALIQDRKVLGGNNSSEVRVGLGGRLNIGDYPSLGYLLNEFGPSAKGNARPSEVYEDDKKLNAVLKEKNITLFLGYRVTAVAKDNSRIIRSVTALHVEDYSRIEVKGKLFADCTGDACVGALAGASWHMGRDPKSRYGESSAPEVEDGITLGASVQWYSVEGDEPSDFPEIEWGLPVDERNVQVVRRGQWYWEVGMRDDQIEEAERIRDYGMYVAYSNWSYLKNSQKYKGDYSKAELAWVSFIAGKRESRRLVGDYVLREQDLKDFVIHKDGTLCTSWYIDNHEPDPDNSLLFPGREYLSRGQLTPLGFYPIPFRCFCCRDLDNMMMAGRNISVSHIALGTVRVMRTTAMMGEVVGLAASICCKEGISPHDVHQKEFGKLKQLMTKGAGNPNMPYLQVYTLIDTTAARSEDC